MRDTQIKYSSSFIFFCEKTCTGGALPKNFGDIGPESILAKICEIAWVFFKKIRLYWAGAPPVINVWFVFQSILKCKNQESS